MAIAFVQSGNNRAVGATAKAFTSNNALGNLIVIAVVLEHSTDTIASVTDTRGNTYAIAGILQGSAGSGYQNAIYYAKNIAAGANTVTVTPTTGTTPVNLAIHEYSGADPTAPLDQVSSATAISTTPNSGSATTTATDELIFGVISSNTAVTADASLTTRVDFTFNIFSYSVDKIGTATGSYAVNGTATSNRWVANMATFKPFVAGAGGGPSTFAALIASATPAPIVLAELQPAQALGPFTLDSGVVYRAPWPRIVQSDVIPGGLYRRLDVVRENATPYTAVASIAACQAAAGSYFYDAAADLVYLHTTTGGTPNAFAFIGVWFTLFMSTDTVTFSDQPLYSPRITGTLPSLVAERPDMVFGVTVSAEGQLQLLNGDGLWDRLATQWIWRRKKVTFKLGGVGLPYTEFVTVGTLRINTLQVDDELCVLGLEQLESILNRSVPIKTFGDITTYALAVEGVASLSQPWLFGIGKDCRPPLTDTSAEVYTLIDINFQPDAVMHVDAAYAIHKTTGARTTLAPSDYTTGTGATLQMLNLTYTYTTYDIRVDVRITTQVPTFGTQVKNVLLNLGEDLANIDTAALLALDASLPATLGVYLTEPMQAADLIHTFEQSVMAQVYINELGRWTARAWDPSAPADWTLTQSDFSVWTPAEDLQGVLDEVRVQYDGRHASGDYSESSSSDDQVLYGSETSDSHRVTTFLRDAGPAATLAQHLRFLKGKPANRITFVATSLLLLQARVGDVVAVTRDRGPVARTGRLDGQLFEIVRLEKALAGADGAPQVSGILEDFGGQTDRIFRLAPAASTWATATDADRAVYGFLSETNGYIDATDPLTRKAKVLW